MWVSEMRPILTIDLPWFFPPPPPRRDRGGAGGHAPRRCANAVVGEEDLADEAGGDETADEGGVALLDRGVWGADAVETDGGAAADDLQKVRQVVGAAGVADHDAGRVGALLEHDLELV